MSEIKEFAPRKKDNGAVLLRVRLSYVHLDEKWSGNEGAEKKYSVSCIIPKEDKKTIAFIEKEIEAAKAEGKAKKWGGSVPRKLSTPLRDGDEEREEDPAYQDAVFFSASSKQPVKTFNKAGVCDPTEIYSGCWGIVSVRFFPYDAAGNKGVGVGLNQVLKWADDDNLGGANTGNDFEGVDGIEMEADDFDDL